MEDENNHTNLISLTHVNRMFSLNRNKQKLFKELLRRMIDYSSRGFLRAKKALVFVEISTKSNLRNNFDISMIACTSRIILEKIFH
jgi:hypothetical protein